VVALTTALVFDDLMGVIVEVKEAHQ
jgi:hypothetical protein